MEADGKRWIIHGSKKDTFRIWNISDIHWMSRACAEKQVKADIKKIADDPYSFWLGGGDYCEFIGYSDKRFDPDSVAERVSVKDLGNLGMTGMRQIRDLFEPIKHKCLGLLIGNHEKKYELATEHEGLHHWLCCELGVRSLEYSALFDIVFLRIAGARRPRLGFYPSRVKPCGSEAFRIFAHHGAGYAQTVGGKINRLTDFMNRFRADIYFIGHVHDKVGRRKETLGGDTNCSKLVNFTQLGVISGSYLKTYAQGVTTYGEQRGYEPTVIGAAWIEINPFRREMHGEV